LLNGPGMTRPMIFLLLALVLVACDNGEDADTPESCEEMSATWQAIVDSLEYTCDSDDDCIEVGGQYFPTCNCAGILGSGLSAAPWSVYEASGARALEIQFWEQCSTFQTICDRAPPRVSCGSNGHCYASERSCFDCPGPFCSADAAVEDAAVDAADVDAGVDAAAGDDADSP
jgi:hypothetical protein